MKQFVFTLIAGSFCFGSASAQQVKVEGNVKLEQPVEKVYLMYRKGTDRVTDSSSVKDGKFSFTETLQEPTLVMINFKFTPKEGENVRPQGMQVYLEPGLVKIDVQDSVQAAKVTGSKSQTAFEGYQKSLKPYNDQVRGMGERYQKLREAKDEAGMQSIDDEYEALMKERNEKVLLPFIKANLSSPVALYVLNEYAGYDIDPAVAEPIFVSLSAANKNSEAGKTFSERLEKAKKTAVGAYAINFTQNDTLDKPVSLSDFKGKYVLLDFWASWCGPCRAENPNVVKAFNDYKDKGFTVLGVSLDQPGKKDLWLKAIHDDNLTWTQVSDLKFWNNEVAQMYGIQAIPQNFLIDPQGKIIAKNIRGEELGKKLEEVIK